MYLVLNVRVDSKEYWVIDRKIYILLLTYLFMITINETFTDEEGKILKEKKGDLSWHDFIMLLQFYEKEVEEQEQDGRTRTR